MPASATLGATESNRPSQLGMEASSRQPGDAIHIRVLLVLQGIGQGRELAPQAGLDLAQ